MIDTSLQRQARALGDPTRHAIFTWIGDRPSPASIIEIRSHFGFNHTTIRQHLLQLLDAGLLVESQASPTGPGRPKRLYSMAPGARGGWVKDGPYERLTTLLLDVMRSGRTAREVGREAGLALMATSTLLDAPTDAVVKVADEVARQGFAPRVEKPANASKRTDLVLMECPFATAAEADPDTVCELHRGLAEGMADAVGGVHVTDLVVRPAKRAGCRLKLSATT